MKCFYCEEEFQVGQYISVYKDQFYCSNNCVLWRIMGDKEIKRIEYKGEKE